MNVKGDSLRILLVDPTHTYQTLANDCFPIGIGFIASYLKANLGEAVDCRLEKYPDRAITAINEFRPQVLLVANYLWNSNMSSMLAVVAKETLPGVLVVQGGPNFPIEPEPRQAYLERHPEMDLYVVGEGEEATLQLVQDFLASDGTLAGLIKTGRLGNCCYMQDGTIQTVPPVPRIADYDQIPSPYLDGTMDQFFDGQLYPQIETNRGCPFTCTFCQQGTTYFTKVRYYDVERVKEELDYIAGMIAEKAPQVHTLGVVDANFGMYERDIDIAGHIGQIQKDTGWPTFIEVTTGKNRFERVLRTVELLNNSLPILSSVQSLDDEVLKNIKRTNIKLSSYDEIQKEVQRKGLQSKSEIILGLPGETLDSHLRTIRLLIQAETQRINTYQLMLLMGTEMEYDAEEFKFDTRWRVLPRSFGDYDGRKVLEIEEVVVSTSTLSFPDYLQARRMHLLVNIFYNEWLFREIVEYIKAQGLSPFDWLLALDAGMASAPPKVRQLMDEFTHETEIELFDSEDEARVFYSAPGNFEQLTEGEIGSNLLFKYWSMGLFICFDEITDYAFECLRGLLESSGIQKEEVDQLQRFTRQRLVFDRALAREFAPAEEAFSYDFAQWSGDGYVRPLADYRRDTTFRFELPLDRQQVVTDNLDIWGTSLVGLTKMMTRVFVSDFKADVKEVAVV